MQVTVAVILEVQLASNESSVDMLPNTALPSTHTSAGRTHRPETPQAQGQRCNTSDGNMRLLMSGAEILIFCRVS